MQAYSRRGPQARLEAAAQHAAAKQSEQHGLGCAWDPATHMFTLVHLLSIWVWLLRCCGQRLDLRKGQFDHCLRNKRELGKIQHHVQANGIAKGRPGRMETEVVVWPQSQPAAELTTEKSMLNPAQTLL